MIKRGCAFTGWMVGVVAIALSALSPARITSAHAADPSEAEAKASAIQVLEAGNIRGELLVFGQDKKLPAGSGAFAQLTLSTESTAKRGVDAEVIVEAAAGQAVSITGASVSDEDGRPARKAKIEGLRKGRNRLVLVEVKLPQSDSESSKVKIVLRPLSNTASSGADKESAAEIVWAVRDCAGSYAGALQQIRQNEALRATEIWKEATRAESDLPRKWLFQAKTERRSRRRRRSEPEVTASSPVKNQREIYSEAAKFISAGRDPALNRDSNLGWVLGKVASDLDTYLSQPAKPAICTGGPGLADYYERRLAALTKHGERLSGLASDAKTMAQGKVESAFRAARDLSEETAGWGGVTPVAAKAMAIKADTLTGMTASLAELAGLSGELVAKIGSAPDAYEALKIVHEEGLGTDGLPELVRNEIRSALSAIEAAARIDAVNGRHSGVQTAFMGRVAGIREAHATHCVCESR